MVPALCSDRCVQLSLEVVSFLSRFHLDIWVLVFNQLQFNAWKGFVLLWCLMEHGSEATWVSLVCRSQGEVRAESSTWVQIKLWLFQKLCYSLIPQASLSTICNLGYKRYCNILFPIFIPRCRFQRPTRYIWDTPEKTYMDSLQHE